MDFLGVENKTFLVFGVANKKSVAYHVSQVLSEQGVEVVHVVKSQEIRENVAKILPGADIYTCDVECEEEITKLAEDISKKRDFLQAVDISCYSLIGIANAFKDLLDEKASVVTISISTTKTAAEPYGYMSPVKAALDSTICFLAKSFSAFSQVRFNSVNAGLLKTSSSAGIPGYVDYYLYAEKLTLRKKALATQEVANTAAFLLSERSSGINAQGIVVDCGMSVNAFDKDIIRKAVRPE
jgi:enoyl-[acyl-carrier protein] reductase I